MHTCGQRWPGPGLQRARRRSQAGVGCLAALAAVAVLAVLVAIVVGRVEALEAVAVMQLAVAGTPGYGAGQERGVLVAAAMAVAVAVVVVATAVVVVALAHAAVAAFSATAAAATFAVSVDMGMVSWASVNETRMLVCRGIGGSSSVDLARARVGRRHFKQGGE